MHDCHRNAFSECAGRVVDHCRPTRATALAGSPHPPRLSRKTGFVSVASECPHSNRRVLGLLAGDHQSQDIVERNADVPFGIVASQFAQITDVTDVVAFTMVFA